MTDFFENLSNELSRVQQSIETLNKSQNAAFDPTKFSFQYDARPSESVRSLNEVQASISVIFEETQKFIGNNHFELLPISSLTSMITFVGEVSDEISSMTKLFDQINDEEGLAKYDSATFIATTSTGTSINFAPRSQPSQLH
ncbi:hypothetical protein [Mariluticola halotolerans]|uniref:hypothetical protein n=1 Tax=Mariluticola halotolerans TaxID=2909283 RepID=UPI0026E3650B|nr:hypothetical protein [Mariluticola halotolerans]UJQ93332.1 hypothetical protein L1P08_10010 [Mariluticola halotolerans]